MNVVAAAADLSNLRGLPNTEAVKRTHKAVVVTENIFTIGFKLFRTTFVKLVRNGAIKGVGVSHAGARGVPASAWFCHPQEMRSYGEIGGDRQIDE